ncbi:phytoene/squalene synthase family protein [Gynurincola endophyticus]|uniref:phytoene/squalene synthase family protein n=1 Tax=Gynurincola endophyticus TaxID=2479004 RepID=UPI000F8F70AB|nr:phytoene/squalene synthase family protein [Gynurincola endophyticus]
MNSISLFTKAGFKCSRHITQSYSTSFSSAINLLHADLRDPVHGIYGLVRLADEIVDTFHDYNKRELLEKFKHDTYEAIHNRISLNPVLQSFQITVNKYNIEPALIDAFFDSMFVDLDKKSWTTPDELNKYIYGSAEVVGLMCLKVFCEGNQQLTDELKPAAMSLGAAFQKVNFLRDLNDDLTHLERQYFPYVDLKNISQKDKEAIEADILKDFSDAYKGIILLPVKARFGVLVAYKYYLCLFHKIKNLPPEALFKKRIRVPNFQKALLLMKAGFERPFQLG